jgi:tetratricopeptide (TPR) repeat protein
MTKFTIALAGLLFTCISAGMSQNTGTGTFQVIEKRMQADTSLYAQLAARFSQGDTTLAADDLALVYFGSVLRPEFNPAQENRIVKAGNALTRRGRHEEAIRLLDQLLTKHPASLSAWLEKSYALWEAGRQEESNACYARFQHLLKAPLSSGTGKSFETAIAVRMVEDESIILIEKGWVAAEEPKLMVRQGQRFHLNTCTAAGDVNRRETLYFNVELPLARGVQPALRRKSGN